MATAAAVSDRLFRCSTHRHQNHRRPPNPRCALPTSRYPLSPHLSMLPNSSSLETTASNRKPMPEIHFLKHFNSSLESGDYGKALVLLENKVATGYRPRSDLCTKLIKAFSDSPSSLRSAERVLDILERHGSPEIDAYNSLITALCRADRIDSALSLLGSMRCPPNSITYDLVIDALCKRRRISEAFYLLPQMLSSANCYPSFKIWTSLVAASIADVGVTRTIALVKEISVHGIAPSTSVYNAILRDLCRQKQLDQALHLLNVLSSSTSGSVDVASYNAVAGALFDARRWADGEALLAEMVSRGKISPDVCSYTLLVKALCGAGRVVEAMRVVEKDMAVVGITPDSYTYDPVVEACCRRGKIDLAVAFLQRILAGGGQGLGIITYTKLLTAMCKQGMAPEAAGMLRALEGSSCRPDVKSYTVVISGLWAQGQREAVVGLLGEMLEKRVMPDKFTYNALISKLCKHEWLYEAMELAVCMVEARIMPDAVTYNTLISELMKLHKVEAMELARKLFSLRLISKHTLHDIEKSTNLLPSKLSPAS